MMYFHPANLTLRDFKNHDLQFWLEHFFGGDEGTFCLVENRLAEQLEKRGHHWNSIDPSEMLEVWKFVVRQFA